MYGVCSAPVADGRLRDSWGTLRDPTVLRRSSSVLLALRPAGPDAAKRKSHKLFYTKTPNPTAWHDVFSLLTRLSKILLARKVDDFRRTCSVRTFWASGPTHGGGFGAKIGVQRKNPNMCDSLFYRERGAIASIDPATPASKRGSEGGRASSGAEFTRSGVVAGRKQPYGRVATSKNGTTTPGGGETRTGVTSRAPHSPTQPTRSAPA
jgi:hypothetical protein